MDSIFSLYTGRTLVILVSFWNKRRKQHICLSVVDHIGIWELPNSNHGWGMGIMAQVYCGFSQSFEGEVWTCWVLSYANLRSPIRNNNKKYYFNRKDNVNRNIKALNLHMVSDKDTTDDNNKVHKSGIASIWILISYLETSLDFFLLYPSQYIIHKNTHIWFDIKQHFSWDKSGNILYKVDCNVVQSYYE
jgi:hypothetical protein